MISFSHSQRKNTFSLFSLSKKIIFLGALTLMILGATISQAAPPAPTITSISPTSTNAGTSFTLSVNGSNFVSGAAILMNGLPIAGQTIFINSSKLSITFTPQQGGDFPITVVNPDGSATITPAFLTVAATGGPTGCNVNSDCGTNGPTGGFFCQNGSVYQNYQTWICNNPGGLNTGTCSATTSAQLQQNCPTGQSCVSGVCELILCTPNSTKGCIGNDVYWYDSCGNAGNLYQTCPTGQTCSNGACIPSTCTSHTSQQCVGNTVYWFDSCGNQQDLYQTCTTSQTCSNGVCVNPHPGTFILVKKTTGGDDTFNFTTFGGNGLPGTISLKTVNGGATQNFPNILPGTYGIAESLPAGWDLSSASCSGTGNTISSFTIVANGSVTCTFNDTKRASIEIVKKTIGGTGTFSFTSNFGATPITIPSGSTSNFEIIPNLPVGIPYTYNVSEVVPSGWNLTGSSCTSGTPTNIFPSPGQTVICTFTNTKILPPATTLTVNKAVIPSTDPGKFNLLINGTAYATNVGDKGTTGPVTLSPTIYSVSETAGTGTNLSDYTTSITCDNNVTSTPGVNTTVTLNLGDVKTCTITNTRKPLAAAITVVKKLIPSTDTGKFNLLINGTTYANNVGDGGLTGPVTFSPTSPSTNYTVSETAVSPAKLSDYTTTFSGDCDSTGNIALAPGTSKTCIITNTRKAPPAGTLIIQKYTSSGGDNGDFPFTITAISGGGGTTPTTPAQPIVIHTAGGSGTSPSIGNIVPGTYNVAESVPAGWSKTSASCTGGNGSDPANIGITAGSTVICTFNDTKLPTYGQITIIKNTIGSTGADIFNFNLNPITGGALISPQPQITTHLVSSTNNGTGTGTTSVNNMVPGTYNLAENVMTGYGWFLSASACQDSLGNSLTPSSLTVTAGSTITCTFTNTKLPTLTVSKVVVNAPGTSSDSGLFNLQINGLFYANNIATGTTGAQMAAIGTNSFAETGGSNNTNLTDYTSVISGTGCASTNSTNTSGTISLAAGDQKTCTITNTRKPAPATIIIKKTSSGGDGSFYFSVSAVAGGGGTTPTTPAQPITITTVNGTATPVTISNVTAGIYNIAENTPSGWNQTSASCTGGTGTNPASITIAAGQTVTCSFANTKIPTYGKLTIVKNTIGSTTSNTFNFNLNPISGGAQISPQPQIITTNTSGTTNGTGSTSVTNITPGTYNLTESPITGYGWNLTGTACTGGASPSNLSIPAGADITCTFTNTKNPVLRIVKNIIPTTDTGLFNLLVNGVAQAINVGNNGTTGPMILNPTSYVVGESGGTGTDLSTYTSVIGGDCAASGAITLNNGDDKTCTITNTRKPSTIVITKKTTGGDGTFSFTTTGGNGLPSTFGLTTVGGTATQTYPNITPGNYSIAETVPSGWDLSNASCSTGSPGGFTLAPGATVTCTFNDIKQASIQIIKKTVGGNTLTNTFTFTSNFGVSSITIPAGQTTGSQTVANLSIVSPLIYSISETPPAGWNLTSSSCNSGTPSNIGLVAGQTTICTFTNTKPPSSITVNKVISPAADTGKFNLLINGTVYASNIGNGGTTGAISLDPASPSSTYTISETAGTGTILSDYDTAITCDKNITSTNGTSTSVDLPIGAAKVCTITNTKKANIGTCVGVGGSYYSGNYGTKCSSGTCWIQSSSCQTGFANAYVATGNAAYAGWWMQCAVNSSNLKLDTNPCPVCPTGSTYYSYNPPNNYGLRNSGGSPTCLGGSCWISAPRSSCQVGYQYWGSNWWVQCDGNLVPDVCSNGKITIVKNSSGGNGKETFAFTTSGFSGPGTLTPMGTPTFATASWTSADLAAGSNYSISETPVAGWTTTASCDNGSPITAINVVAGKTTTCTFTNTKNPGKITIVKNTTGGDGTFNFTTTGGNGLPSALAITTVNGTKTQTYSNISAGTYSISEVTAGGWDLSSASCTGSGNTPANITLTSDQEVICTFNNTKRASIKIIKNIIGAGNNTFSFNSTFGVSSLTTAAGTTSQTVDNLYAGIPAPLYSISENVPAGWTLVSSSCTNGTPSNIILTPGVTTTCTFTNTQQSGHIIVDKVTTPSLDPQIFAFTTTGAGYSGFNLSDASKPNDQVLTPGTYSVAETPQAGWDNTSATCDNHQSPSSITLSGGQTVNCVFQNTKRGHIIVHKVTIPANDPATFNVVLAGSVGGMPGSISALTDGNFEVAPGTYSLTETPTPYWVKTADTCQGITVGAGQTKTCTITNTKLGKLRIVKNAIGGDDSFTYNVSGPTTLQKILTTIGGTKTDDEMVMPGVYGISESLPVDWKFNSATCDDGTSVKALSGVDKITILPGQTTTCTFTNTKNGKIIISKFTTPTKGDLKIISNVIGGNQTFDYTVTGPTNFQASVHTFNGSGSSGPNGRKVNPGVNYTITEALPIEGWTLNSVSCYVFPPVKNTGIRTSNGITKVEVYPGEVTTCVFTNTKNSYIQPLQGSLKILKNAIGGINDTDQFNYTIVGPTSSSQIVTSQTSGTGSNGPNGTGATKGFYAVTELNNSSWTYEYIDCDKTFTPKQNGGIQIEVDPLSTTTCVFTNLQNQYLAGNNRDDTFNYFISPTPMVASVTTSGGTGTTPPISVDPGTYNIIENANSNWQYASVSCTGSFTDNKINGAENIQVGPGQTVKCTFINTKPQSDVTHLILIKDAQPLRGNLKIIQNTIGGDDRFNYTVLRQNIVNYSTTITSANGEGSNGQGGAELKDDSLEKLDINKYVIKQKTTSDWTLSSVVCDNNFLATSDGLKNLIITAGQTTTCTFTNIKNGAKPQGNLKIIKSALALQKDQSFTFTVGGPTTSNPTIATVKGLGVNSNNGGVAKSGMYSLTETIPDGWTLDSAYCDNDFTTGVNGLTSVRVTAGQVTTCTFTNRDNAYIQGDSDSFTYTVTGPTPFTKNVTEINGAGVEHKVVKPSGNFYKVIESPQRGWLFNYAMCYTPGVGGSGVQVINGIKNVYVPSEETTNCIVGNQKQFCPVCPAQPVCTNNTTASPSVSNPDLQKEPLRPTDKQTYPNIIGSNDNPVPVITTLSVPSKNAGSSAFNLIVNGSDFIANSVVNFDGSARTTTFLSASQLSVTITAADLANSGSHSITVFNPTPAGGTSNEILFNVYDICTPCPAPPSCQSTTTPAATSQNPAIEKEPLRPK